jgi:hypothetical protein
MQLGRGCGRVSGDVAAPCWAIPGALCVCVCVCGLAIGRVAIGRVAEEPIVPFAPEE